MKPVKIEVRPTESGGYIAWVYGVRWCSGHKALLDTIKVPTWGLLQDHIRTAGYHRVPEHWNPRVFLDKPRNRYYGCIS